MIQLAIAAVVAIALGSIGLLAKSHLEDKGAAKMRATWAPLIDTCEKSKRGAADCANEWIDAMANVQTLRRTNATLEGERNACRDGVAKQAAEQAALNAQKEQNVAKAMTLAASAQAEAARQREISRQPPKTGATCEQRLQAADASLDELAARQLRFNPSGPTGAGSADAAGAAGAGAGTVRIRQ